MLVSSRQIYLGRQNQQGQAQVQGDTSGFKDSVQMNTLDSEGAAVPGLA